MCSGIDVYSDDDFMCGIWLVFAGEELLLVVCDIFPLLAEITQTIMNGQQRETGFVSTRRI